MITQIQEIPVTDTSYPFTSAKRYGYLAGTHYEENEYYMRGTANVYQTEADGSIGVRFPAAPYVNRLIIRRPSDPEKFSGNVVVEIINPTSFMEIERMWILSGRQLMREGDVYVGITSKPNTIRALQQFNPARYGAMDWSNPTKEEPFPFTAESLREFPNVIPDQDITYETGLFWDMLTDLAKLLKSNDAANPLQALHPQTVVLTGWSQSACYLIRYLNDFAYKDQVHAVYDGFLAAGPPRYFKVPVNQYETLACAKEGRVQIRQVKEPCIVLQTESENSLFGAFDIPRPDGDEPNLLCRHYDITGASHDTLYSLVDYYQDDPDLARIGFRMQYGGHNAEPNNYPYQLIVGAMFRNLFYWIHTGTAPQPCERIQTTSDGKNRKDALGITVGGIRTCLLDHPTGSFYQYSDVAADAAALTPEAGRDNLFGHEEPFPAQMLRRMYGSLENYRELVTLDTDRQIRKGFLVREDAESMINAAMERAKRRGLA